MRVNRGGQSEVLVHGDDSIDHNTTEYDRTSANSQTGSKPGELQYSTVTHQSSPGECRPTDAIASERSIYDNTPEHYYANVEKDESGRLLNRDTLAFRTSDYETENRTTPLMQSNGQVPVAHLVDISTPHTERCQVPVVIHRTNKDLDTNSSSYGPTAERTQSDVLTSTIEHIPYHTGRSTFYQRVDSTEGICFYVH